MPADSTGVRWLRRSSGINVSAHMKRPTRVGPHHTVAPRTRCDTKFAERNVHEVGQRDPLHALLLEQEECVEYSETWPLRGLAYHQ